MDISKLSATPHSSTNDYDRGVSIRDGVETALPTAALEQAWESYDDIEEVTDRESFEAGWIAAAAYVEGVAAVKDYKRSSINGVLAALGVATSQLHGSYSGEEAGAINRSAQYIIEAARKRVDR